VLGRFISPDTLVPDPSDPQDLNRYTYAKNNPMRYTDPTGHRACTLGRCEGGAPKATGGPGAQGSGGSAAMPAVPPQVVRPLVKALVVTATGAAGGYIASRMANSSGADDPWEAAERARRAEEDAAYAEHAAAEGAMPTDDELATYARQLTDEEKDRSLFGQRGIPISDKVFGRLAEREVSEEDAVAAWEGGTKYTDAEGRLIRYDQKTRVTVALDKHNGGINTVWGPKSQAKPSRNWTRGWDKPYDWER
jgi:hypothetical protein